MFDVSRKGRAVRTLGISLALLNLLLWFCVPTIRSFVDEITGRWANANNPQILTGVQELLVYFDPWLARGVFPVIYIAGFAAIPFLKKPSHARTGSRSDLAYAVFVSLFLIAFEFVWLLLIAVDVFLRGPNWNIFWPGEVWDEYKIVPLNTINLSSYSWHLMGRSVGGMAWIMREIPGFVLIGGYLLAGIVLAYGLFRNDLRATAYWRWAVLVLLLQLAALVPLKVVCQCAFNVKYWISLPEYHWHL